MSKVAYLNSHLREQIAQQQERLEQVRQELVDAETELAERLAAINAFEFKLRANIGPYVTRLEAIQAEIEQLRRQLRQFGDQWGDFEPESGFWSVDEVEDVYHAPGAAAAGDFRYRDAATPEPPLQMDSDTQSELKRLYRQLARRFHPDMGVDEADRAYRTDIMSAINAAYAAGDLARLQELALEPDAAHRLEYAQSDEQLLEALLQEQARCHRRLEEINQELARLARQKSARLMQRAQKAEAEGRDWLAEIIRQLKDEIAQKMVERDVLQSEIQFAGAAAADMTLSSNAFADAVWQMSLDQAYDDSTSSEIEDWLQRRRDRSFWDENNEDDIESWS